MKRVVFFLIIFFNLGSLKSEEIAKNIGENFCNSYNEYGINSISYHSKINLDPPKILD